MKTLTPDTTARRLGWTAARQSLKEARTRTAATPKLPRRKSIRNLFAYCKAWLRWIPNTIKLWHGVWKNRRTHGDYAALAKQGVPSREIFRHTGRKMHLTEDEISAQARKIFNAEFNPKQLR